MESELCAWPTSNLAVAGSTSSEQLSSSVQPVRCDPGITKHGTDLAPVKIRWISRVGLYTRTTCVGRLRDCPADARGGLNRCVFYRKHKPPFVSISSVCEIASCTLTKRICDDDNNDNYTAAAIAWHSIASRSPLGTPNASATLPQKWVKGDWRIFHPNVTRLSLVQR